MANSAFMESDEGPAERQKAIQATYDDFEEIVQGILNPQPEVDLTENPFFAAGERGLDRLRWNYKQPTVNEG